MEIFPSCPRTDCVNKNSELCKSCSVVVKTSYNYREYIPTCIYKYTDCICDPAYIKHYHPNWYSELYGDKLPSEIKCYDCEDGDQYDDEDK